MNDKPDVAALTDEQCDAIIAAMPIVGLGTERDWFHALIRAGRASLQANVPADVAALIARLPRMAHAIGCPGRFPDSEAQCSCWRAVCVQAATALQSQQDKVAEFDWMNNLRHIAEARVAELEAALRIFDPGLNSLDASKVPPLQINEQSK